MQTWPSSEAEMRLRGKDREGGVKKESAVTEAEWSVKEPISAEVERS